MAAPTLQLPPYEQGLPCELALPWFPEGPRIRDAFENEGERLLLFGCTVCTEEMNFQPTVPDTVALPIELVRPCGAD